MRMDVAGRGRGLERRLGNITAVSARELLDHRKAKAKREGSDQDHQHRNQDLVRKASRSAWRPDVDELGARLPLCLDFSSFP